MNEVIKADLHLHSSFSDGAVSPEELAGLLAGQGVRLAALTDHNTFAGQMRFARALKTYGIQAITGMELSLPAGSLPEIHLLVYGCDTENATLRQLTSEAALNRLAASFKKTSGVKHPASGIFDLIHRAGGTIFLAHPYWYVRNPVQCEALILEYKQAGLDGLECYYKSYTNEQVMSLVGLAEKYDLLISGGSDFHYPEIKTDRLEYSTFFRPHYPPLPGIDIPRTQLRYFIKQLGI